MRPSIAFMTLTYLEHRPWPSYCFIWPMRLRIIRRWVGLSTPRLTRSGSVSRWRKSRWSHPCSMKTWTYCSMSRSCSHSATVDGGSFWWAPLPASFCNNNNTVTLQRSFLKSSTFFLLLCLNLYFFGVIFSFILFFIDLSHIKVVSEISPDGIFDWFLGLTDFLPCLGTSTHKPDIRHSSKSWIKIYTDPDHCVLRL